MKKSCSMFVVMVLVFFTASASYAFTRQKFPAGSPEEAVEKLMYGDYSALFREDNIHYKIGSYNHIPKGAIGGVDTPDGAAWYSPVFKALIDSYKIEAITMTETETYRIESNHTKRATVEVQLYMIGLQFVNIDDASQINDLYAWTNLTITNTLNGSTSKANLIYTDYSSFIDSLRKLGDSIPEDMNYVRIPLNRRLWKFEVNLEFDNTHKVWRVIRPLLPLHCSLNVVIKEYQKMIQWDTALERRLCRSDNPERLKGMTCDSQMRRVQSVEFELKVLNTMR